MNAAGSRPGRNCGVLWKATSEDDLRDYVHWNRRHLAGLLLFEFAHEGRPTPQMVRAAELSGLGPPFERWATRFEGEDSGIPQLRIYEVFEHNKAAFYERFRDHAVRFMRGYGSQIVAMWEAKGEARSEFVYLLAWPDAATKAAGVGPLHGRRGMEGDQARDERPARQAGRRHRRSRAYLDRLLPADPPGT